MPQADADFDSADFARLLHQNKYRLVAKKGEGTFSEVLKAQSTITGEYFAIKCFKATFKSMDQVNSLREIQALRRLNPHANIVDLEEVLYDKTTGRLALVFELLDQNLYELIRGRKQPLKSSTVKQLMYQLHKAVAHMHKCSIFHRDLKPENVLIIGDAETLKVADYGSCRGIYTQAPYTEYISTRWYRPPEALLTNGYYDYKMDMWGLGAVMFEIISLFPLFPGTNELDQVEKIHAILGTPPPEILEQFRLHSSHIKNFNFPPKVGTGIARLIPHASPEAIDLMEKLLAYNPEHRITARQALRHPYFRDLREAEKRERAARTSTPKLTRPVLSAAAGEDDAEPSVSGKDKKKAPEASKKFPSILSTAAASSAAQSSHSSAAPAASGGGTSMPHIGGSSHSLAPDAPSGKTLAGSTDSLPRPDGSPAINKKKKAAPKRRAVVPAPPASVALLASAAASAASPSADDNMSEASFQSCDDADSTEDDLLTKERAALKQKELAKEAALIKNSQAASSGKKQPTLQKTTTQHKLAIASGFGAPTAYSAANVQQQQQQLAALAANLSGSGGGGFKKSSKTSHVPSTNMLPSIGGGSAIGGSVKSAYESSYVAPGRILPPTLAHLKSNASDDYGDFYDREADPSDTSALEMVGARSLAAGHASHGPSPLSVSKKTRAKKKVNALPAGGLLASVAPTEHLSLSGHTATLTMHSSTSTTQLRSGYPGKSSAKGKASAAALSLALQSLDLTKK